MLKHILFQHWFTWKELDQLKKKKHKQIFIGKFTLNLETFLVIYKTEQLILTRNLFVKPYLEVKHVNFRVQAAISN